MYHVRRALWCVLLLLAPTASNGQGVMLSPGTVILSDRARSAEISVGNINTRSAAFEVQEAFYRQDRDGRLIESDPASAPNSALALVRIGPRRFSLAPSEGRPVRVAFRPPAGLPPGEYRLHAIIKNLSDSPDRPREEAVTHEGEARFVIHLAVARGVRILVRYQVIPEGATLGNLTATRDEGGERIEFDVHRHPNGRPVRRRGA